MKLRIGCAAVCIITAIFLFLNCVSPSKSERTHIVSVKGGYGGPCDNFFCTGYYLPMKDSSTSIPLYHGDFVYTKDFFFRYDSTEGNTLTLENKGALFYVNGRLEGLRIENDSAIKRSLAAVSDKDLALLKSVSISDTIPAATLPLIRKIAKSNPHVGLSVSSECIFFDTIISLFDPLWINTHKKDASKQVLSSIAHFTHLIMLRITDLLPVDLDTMKIPGSVKYLSISIDSSFVIKKTEKFKNVETFCLYSGKMFDISFLANMKNLKTLQITVPETTVTGCNALLSCKQLRRLSFFLVQNVKGISSLQSMHSLDWLYLPMSISVSEAESILITQKNLSFLSIYIDDSSSRINNLLTKMPRLKYLRYFSEASLYHPVYGLKQLECLSVPEDIFKYDSLADTLKKLQTALPNVKIVPGGCLGSGWLLLLIPGIFLFSLGAGYVRKRLGR